MDVLPEFGLQARWRRHGVCLGLAASGCRGGKAEILGLGCIE